MQKSHGHLHSGQACISQCARLQSAQTEDAYPGIYAPIRAVPSAKRRRVVRLAYHTLHTENLLVDTYRNSLPTDSLMLYTYSLSYS